MRWRRVALAAVVACFSSVGQVFAEAKIVTPESSRARAASAASGRHFLWRVQSPTGAHGYVIGSIHMLDSSIYPLDAVFEQSFDECDVMALEADVFGGDPMGMLATMMERAMYPEGQTLQSQLTPRDYQEVSQALAQLDLPIEMLQGMRPWFLTMLVVQTMAMKFGLQPELGIDHHFYQKASGRMEVVELESVEMQIGILSKLTDHQGVLLLADSVDDFKSIDDFHAMVDLWRRGDTASMANEVEKDARQRPELKALDEALLRGRNPGMTSGIERLLAAGRTPFVIVGAAHLVGERGVLQLLEQRGYHVEQL